MKKILTSILMFILIAGVAYAEKPFLEYGGTTIFGEARNYEDGYDGNGHSLLLRNTLSELTRTYLTYYYNLSDNSRIRLTLDSGGFQKSGDGFYSSSWIFVKYAYWELKNYMGAERIMLGQIETPWIGWEDKIWDYRMIAKTILDDREIEYSADRGFGVQGKFWPDLEYALAIVGGSGYKDFDRDGKWNTELRLTYKLTDALSASLGGGSGSWSTTIGASSYTPYYQRYTVGNLNYKMNPFVLSYTVFGADNNVIEDFTVQGTVVRTAGQTLSKGASITGVWNAVGGLDVIGRLDTYDPNIEIADDVQKKSIAGFGYKLGEDLRMALTKQTVTQETGENSLTIKHVNYFNMEWKF